MGFIERIVSKVWGTFIEDVGVTGSDSNIDVFKKVKISFTIYSKMIYII